MIRTRGAVVFVSSMFPLTLCLVKLEVMTKKSTLVDQPISFQEHLLQHISWVSLMQVPNIYLGMENNSLTEKSFAIKPSLFPNHFCGKNGDFISGALLGNCWLRTEVWRWFFRCWLNDWNFSRNDLDLQSTRSASPLLLPLKLCWRSDFCSRTAPDLFGVRLERSYDDTQWMIRNGFCMLCHVGACWEQMMEPNSSRILFYILERICKTWKKQKLSETHAYLVSSTSRHGKKHAPLPLCSIKMTRWKF